MKTSIDLHHRNSTRGKNFSGSLFVRIIRERKSASITLPYTLFPEEWDRNRKRVRWEDAPKSRLDYLRRVERETVQVLSCLRQLADRLTLKGAFSSLELVAAYRLKTSGCSFFSFASSLCEEMRAAGKISSVRSYTTALLRLKNFTGNGSLSFSDITPRLIRSLEEHLQKEGMSRNTTSSYMRSLRAIYNKAVESGRADRTGIDPFMNVYTGVDETRKRALSEKEINRIAKHVRDFSADECSPSEEEKLQKARRYFLFAFLAQGMSFVDMAFLRKTDIRGNQICYRRRKTGQRIVVSITPELRKLIRSYADQVKNSPYVLPVISRPGENEFLQYESALRLQNKWLKRLTANLSTHVARHTWATIARRKNLPVGLISECLGHTSEKTTRIYLGAFDGRALADANRKVTCILS